MWLLLVLVEDPLDTELVWSSPSYMQYILHENEHLNFFLFINLLKFYYYFFKSCPNSLWVSFISIILICLHHE
jgi:hypothetical protein